MDKDVYLVELTSYEHAKLRALLTLGKHLLSTPRQKYCRKSIWGIRMAPCGRTQRVMRFALDNRAHFISLCTIYILPLVQILFYARSIKVVLRQSFF